MLADASVFVCYNGCHYYIFGVLRISSLNGFQWIFIYAAEVDVVNTFPVAQRAAFLLSVMSEEVEIELKTQLPEESALWPRRALRFAM